jgi:periplasmic glucans biosynthesis protein
VRDLRPPVSRWLARAFLAVAASNACAFALEDVVDRARQLAARPYVPVAEVPQFIRDIGYDQHRGMRYRARYNVWRDADSRFQVSPLMPGGVYRHAVPINEIVGSTVTRIPFRKQHFSFDEDELRQRIPDDLGYAGFELLYAFDRPAGHAKFMVFAGASYFRAIGKGGQWGLSIRGAAIDTGLTSGEEFPDFVEFWLARPRPRATRMTVYALLDSPRLAGAYEFVISPGTVTRMTVTAVLFARERIEQLGIAALTSMYFYGENTPRPVDAWRPEVHDSDGLLVQDDAGRWTWQPLQTPSRITIHAFSGETFGLMQRDTHFRSYEDAEANYHRRPSALVTIERRPGHGRVLLVQLPTKNEFLDNIVAMWSPAGAVDGGNRLDFKYQLTLGAPAIANTKLGQVVNTFVGRDVIDATSKAGQHRFIVDFDGVRFAPGETAAAVIAHVRSQDGTQILEHQLKRLEPTGSWRLSILARGEADKPLTLRAALHVNGRQATETWSYELDANNVLRQNE